MTLAIYATHLVSRAHTAETTAPIRATNPPVAIWLACNTLSLFAGGPGFTGATKTAAAITTALLAVTLLHTVDAVTVRTFLSGRTGSTDSSTAIIAAGLTITLRLTGFALTVFAGVEGRT